LVADIMHTKFMYIIKNHVMLYYLL